MMEGCKAPEVMQTQCRLCSESSHLNCSSQYNMKAHAQLLAAN